MGAGVGAHVRGIRVGGGLSPTVTEDRGLSHTQLSFVTSARQGWSGEDFEGIQMRSGLGQAGSLAELVCADLLSLHLSLYDGVHPALDCLPALLPFSLLLSH